MTLTFWTAFFMGFFTFLWLADAAIRWYLARRRW
jgi:hypothetical protein